MQCKENEFALFSNNSHKYECDQRCPCLCDVLLILPQRCLLHNRILAHLLPSVKCVEMVWFITTAVLWCHWRTRKRHLKGIYLASLLFCLPFSWKRARSFFIHLSYSPPPVFSSQCPFALSEESLLLLWIFHTLQYLSSYSPDKYGLSSTHELNK